jgi:hypothetical protein
VTEREDDLGVDRSGRGRLLDKEIAAAQAREARRSDLEGRVMRSPGGNKLLDRMARRKAEMPRIKQ